MTKCYYYCNLNTYISMIKSKCLWLTDLTKSNDSQEVTRLYKNIWNSIKPDIIKSGIDENLVSMTFDRLEPTFEIQIMTDIPYGCCFCMEPDKVNLWIEYGDKGKGVCLEFDLDWFPIKRQHPITAVNLMQSIGYERVLYDSLMLKNNITNICCEALKENGNAAWFNGILSTFKHYAAFIKNPTFDDENEIRIVYYPFDSFDISPETIGLSDLVDKPKPHYCLSWYKERSMALTGIIVGPNCEYTEEQIGTILLTENVIPENPIPICKSQSSYRERM